MKKSLVFIYLLFALLLTSFQLKAKKVMTPVDLLSIPAINVGILSGDAENLYYELAQVNWKKNKRVSQLWRHNLASNEISQLTFSENSSSDPLISPDSQLLAFVSRREEDDNNQIYLLRSNGGEAYKPISLDSGPKDLTWSQDSQSLYFRSLKVASSQFIRKVEKKEVIKKFEDPEKVYLLWKLDVKTGDVVQISQPDYSVREFSLVDKDKKIVFSKASGVLIDQRHSADVWEMDSNGGNHRRLTRNTYSESYLQPSPEGKYIAYLASVNKQQKDYYNNNIFLLEKNSKKVDLLTEKFGGDIESLRWSKNGKDIYFTANVGVSTHLFKLNINSKSIEQITRGDFTIKEWSYHANTGVHVVKKQSAISPGEIFLLKCDSCQLQPVTQIHHKMVSQYRLPEQKKINWRGYDGQALEGLLTYPLDYEKGKKYPLVVQTHGGPRSSDQFGIWSSTDYLPVLSAHGYATLMVNHRGSVGYGDSFLRDMVGSYFRNAHLDVLSGIDFLIEEGIADSEKLVKMGWSAGGHMTNKLITVTDRFKVASSGAGTVDWISHYGETDTSYKRTWWFGGKPWQENAPINAYIENSPFKDLWKVKTPTLIFVGGRDVRVPSSQSKILFRALRDLGVETELYIAPGEPHNFKKITHRLFKINKELEWFEKYIHGKKYEHQSPPKGDA